MDNTIRLRNGQMFRSPDYEGWDDEYPVDEEGYYDEYDYDDVLDEEAMEAEYLSEQDAYRYYADDPG